MIVGDKSIFAIESHIEESFESSNLRALGFFIIHIDGYEFGVREKDATMLQNSYEEVLDRLKNKGNHLSPGLNAKGGVDIAIAYQNIWYGDGDLEQFHGISPKDFDEMFLSPKINWAPDGDAAFDDGGNILQLDEDDEIVRIIAFKNEDNIADTLSSIKEIRIASEVFYGILKLWSDSFFLEWKNSKYKY